MLVARQGRRHRAGSATYSSNVSELNAFASLPLFPLLLSSSSTTALASISAPRRTLFQASASSSTLPAPFRALFPLLVAPAPAHERGSALRPGRDAHTPIAPPLCTWRGWRTCSPRALVQPPANRPRMAADPQPLRRLPLLCDTQDRARDANVPLR
jgi:hypothetical protein